MMGALKSLYKRGDLKATQVAKQQSKQQENHPKMHFSQQNKKKTRENAHRMQENDFF